MGEFKSNTIQESFDVLHNIPGIGVGCTQYVPQIFNNIDVLFLGHDAHEGGDLNIETRYLKAHFMHGNNCGTPVEWRKCAEWKIWNIRKIFKALTSNNAILL